VPAPVPHVSPSAPQTPVLPNPLGWWRLDESAGTAAADASGGRNDGTFNEVAWVPGRWGNAASLNYGYLTVNHAVADTARSFTVSAWVRLTSDQDWATAVSQNGEHTCAFALQYNVTAHRWGFGMPESDIPFDGHNPVVRYSNSIAPPALNTWTHLTGVYDGARKTSLLYVDGTAQGPGTPVIAWPARASFLIGAARWDDLTGINLWPGQIDDVRIYNRALTPAQIRQLP
jgi:hypothetical protein